MDEIIATLCSALGRSQPRLTLPAGAARALAGLIEDGARHFSRPPPIVRATIDKYTEDVAVDGARFSTQTGFTPNYDLTAGWQETVAEMRYSGDL